MNRPAGFSSTATPQMSPQMARARRQNGQRCRHRADVCDTLELGNPAMTAERLDEDERPISSIDTDGGPRQMLIITEPLQAPG